MCTGLFGAASVGQVSQLGLGGALLGVVSAGKIQQRGHDVHKANHGVVRVATFLLVRVAYDEGHVKAALVHCCFTSGKGHAVIAGEHNNRIFPFPILLEDLHQPSQPLIHARGALVILR